MHLHGGDIYRNKGMLDFSANINMLGTPRKVIEAAYEGISLSANYPDPLCDELRQEISRHEGINKEYIFCGNGAAEIFFALVFAARPKKALLPIPSFYEYEQALKAVECELKYYDIEENNDFILNENILQAIDESIDMIFLCNPNNPTGALIEKDLLEKIIKKCDDCKTTLVLDECFIDMLEETEKYTMKEWIGKTKYLVLVKAFTKLYAMAGIRLGYAFTSNTDLILNIKRVIQPWNVSLPAQRAGLAALEEGDYVKEYKRILKEEKKYLLDELARLKIKTYKPGANFIFLHSEKDLYNLCYKEGVLIRDCSNYPGLRKDFYRIAIKSHEENEKLIKALSKIKSE